MRAKKHSDMAAILTKVIADLRDLSSEEQQKLLETVATFFGVRAPTQSPSQARGIPTVTPVSHPPGGGFSEARDVSPKEFIIRCWNFA